MSIALPQSLAGNYIECPSMVMCIERSSIVKCITEENAKFEIFSYSRWRECEVCVKCRKLGLLCLGQYS